MNLPNARRSRAAASLVPRAQACLQDSIYAHARARTCVKRAATASLLASRIIAAMKGSLAAVGAACERRGGCRERVCVDVGVCSGVAV